MSTVVIVPGWKGSGPGHWQSLWAQQLEDAVRVEQDDWATPNRRDWVQRLADTILAQPGPVVIAAHSLGCITTVHLPPAVLARVAGAYARAWGSDFVRLPHAGHINIESGHGDWPLGLALLRSLVPATVAA